MASLAQKHTWYRRPKATCLRCNTDPCRLLQLCTCRSESVRLRSGMAPLQRVLHTAVRFVLHLRARDHITVALQTLHWLPVQQSIYYLKAMHTDLWCCLRICAFLSTPTLCCSTTLDATRNNASELRVRLLGISYPYLFVKWTVLRRSSTV